MKSIGSEGDRNQNMASTSQDQFGAGRQALARGDAGVKHRDDRPAQASGAIEARKGAFEKSLKQREGQADPPADATKATGAALAEIADAERDGAWMLASSNGGFQPGLPAPLADAPTPAAVPSTNGSVEARIGAIAERVERVVREEMYLRAGDGVSLKIPLQGISTALTSLTVSVSPKLVEITLNWADNLAGAARQEAVQGLVAQLQARFANRRVVVSDAPETAAAEGATGGSMQLLGSLFRQSGGTT